MTRKNDSDIRGGGSSGIGAGPGSPKTHLKVGDAAHDFTVAGIDGKPVALEDFSGKGVVLAFYPAAFTVGCTKEMTAYTAEIKKFQDIGFEVVSCRPTIRRASILGRQCHPPDIQDGLGLRHPQGFEGLRRADGSPRYRQSSHVRHRPAPAKARFPPSSSNTGFKCSVEGRGAFDVGEAEGVLVPATVIDRVTPAMRLFRAESFGPAVAVVRAADEAEAIRLANDNEYGLAASVFTAIRPMA